MSITDHLFERITELSYHVAVIVFFPNSSYHFLHFLPQKKMRSLADIIIPLILVDNNVNTPCFHLCPGPYFSISFTCQKVLQTRTLSRQNEHCHLGNHSVISPSKTYIFRKYQSSRYLPLQCPSALFFGQYLRVKSCPRAITVAAALSNSLGKSAHAVH